MEGRLLLKNCTVLREGKPAFGRALVLEGARVAELDDAQVPVLPGDWEIACRGRLVVPGKRTVFPPVAQVDVARYLLARGLLEGVTRVDALPFPEVADVGVLAGDPAEDLLVLDFVPARGRQVDEREVASAPVAWVIVGGLVRVRERQLVSLDLADLAAKRAAALSVDA